MTSSESTLVFDADDTLWENNVRFNNVFDEFVSWLNHESLSHAEIATVFAAIQKRNVGVYGYGGGMFLHSLYDCYAELRGKTVTDGERRHLSDLAAVLVDGRVEPMPGVVETLTELGRRHTLIMLTKGGVEEQQPKIDHSGLAAYFRYTHIVAEKDVSTYRWLVAEHDLTPDRTWMIGNSPKSDIAPARAAGLNAVFIPNEHTWELEHQAIDPHDPGVLEVPAFAGLLKHF